jgi:hypothetical protein
MKCLPIASLMMLLTTPDVMNATELPKTTNHVAPKTELNAE